MSKKEYNKWVAKFGLGFFSWLKVLPLYDEDGEAITLKNPVPIVFFPIKKYEVIQKRIEKAGFHFEWSTIHYVTGYDIPEEHMMKALVKTKG